MRENLIELKRIDIKKMEEDIIEEPEEEKTQKGPLVMIGAVFLILLLIVMIVPYWSVRIDPSPKNVPNWDSIPLEIHNQSFEKFDNVYTAKEISNPQIKALANYISTTSCSNGGRVCYAKALFSFVQEGNYVSDPSDGEFVQPPLQTFLTGGGDCDDGAVLLASLLGAVGVETKFVFEPRHVFIAAFLPEARNGYKTEGDWVYLDWTCSSCEFGELP